VTLFDERQIWAVDPGPDLAFVKWQIRELAAAVEARENLIQQNLAVREFGFGPLVKPTSREDLDRMEARLREALDDLREQRRRMDEGKS
jgi:hypothetical protein